MSRILRRRARSVGNYRSEHRDPATIAGTGPPRRGPLNLRLRRGRRPGWRRLRPGDRSRTISAGAYAAEHKCAFWNAG
jgi:hypothetical protein